MAGKVAAAGLPPAAAATHTPFSGAFWSEPIVPAGQPIPDKDTALTIGAGPGYFETLGIRIVAGRPIPAAATRRAACRLRLSTRRSARRHFPGRAAVGQLLAAKVNGALRQLTIVGVAEDTRNSGVREPAAADGLSRLLRSWSTKDGGICSSESLVIRRRSPASLEPVVRAAMPATPFEAQPLGAQVSAALVRERVLALLAAGFGLLALLLSAVGLYGLVAYGVTQRTRELGVRVAMGARRGQILGLVFKDAARLVAIGAAVGVPAAWSGVRVGADAAVRGDAGGSAGTDWCAGGAGEQRPCLPRGSPARRAARVDPLVALRHE